jgi:hypothetical protein
MGSIRARVALVVLALTLSLATSTAAQPLSGPEFIPLATPCRALDTRVTGTPLQANVARTIKIGGVTTGGANCGIPTTAAGATLNFTVTQPQGRGHMAAWPSGPLPQTAAVNFDAGEDAGNAIDIGLGAGGTVIVQSIVATHLVVDIYGYFTDVEELVGGNTALGANALATNTTGVSNTALGEGALFSNTTGSFNTSTGVAPSRNTRAPPTPHGAWRPRQQHLGSTNTALGEGALFSNTTGSFNTSTGSRALESNTTGITNTALGFGALRNNTTGGDNTATGSGALASNTTGQDNTALGEGALEGNTTGNNNIAVGIGAGVNVTIGSNNIYIGNFGVSTDNRRIRIGSQGNQQEQTATFIAGIRGRTTSEADALPVLIDSDGQLGTANSSRRVKTDIHDLGDHSRALHQLRPVSFRYRSHPPDGPLEYGLIAEEVAEIYPDLVVRDTDGQPSGVRYHVLPAMLLNELQRQQRTVEAQASRLAEYDERFRDQTRLIEIIDGGLLCRKHKSRVAGASATSLACPVSSPQSGDAPVEGPVVVRADHAG